jgi:hypothetical protein
MTLQALSSSLGYLENMNRDWSKTQHEQQLKRDKDARPFRWVKVHSSKAGQVLTRLLVRAVMYAVKGRSPSGWTH